MNGIIRIAGSVVLFAGVCMFSLSASVPVRDTVAVSVDNVFAVTSQCEMETDTAEIPALQKTSSDTEAVIVGAVTPVSLVKEVTGTEKIKGKLTVGKDETMYVRDGGVLYVDTNSKLVLKGRLIVEDGGQVYVRGNVDSQKGSTIVVRGKTKILSTGSLKLAGNMNITSGGVIKGNGDIKVVNRFDDIKCKGKLSCDISAPKPVVKDGVTYVGGVLLVNKEYSLPSDYGDGLDADAYSAFLRMKQDSGYNMTIVSGYRSYEKQKNTFNNWCAIDGYDKAVTYSAKPGHSEHQTGLAIDVTSIVTSYGDTAEGKWLAQNCHKYGFIIRYPKGKTDITGYIYEPWHIRYVGVEVAKLIHDSGLTLEEFLGVY